MGVSLLLYIRVAASMTDIGGALVTFYALDLFMLYGLADIEYNSIGKDGFVTLLERKSATNHANEYKSNSFGRVSQED